MRKPEYGLEPKIFGTGAAINRYGTTALHKNCQKNFNDQSCQKKKFQIFYNHGSKGWIQKLEKQKSYNLSNIELDAHGCPNFAAGKERRPLDHSGSIRRTGSPPRTDGKHSPHSPLPLNSQPTLTSGIVTHLPCQYTGHWEGGGGGQGLGSGTFLPRHECLDPYHYLHES